jgi:hypothetical protein
VSQRVFPLRQELLLTGGCTDAEHSRWTGRRIAKLVWRIGRNVDGFAGAHDAFLPSKSSLKLALEDHECFFEVMPVRRRASASSPH